jgi:oxygen-independent coproporphyrinogen-3 oxidase
MTSLRTQEGLDLNKLPGSLNSELRGASKKFLESGKLILKENKLILTKEGKLFADGIAAELFVDTI